MTRKDLETVRVLTETDLMAMVVPREPTRKPPVSEPVEGTDRIKPDAPAPSGSADAFLRQAARYPGRNQKELFSLVPIDAGSTQNTVIKELLNRYGFIRRERCGRSWQVYVTDAGRAYLAKEPCRLRGVGGERHRRCVEAMVWKLRRLGYTRVEVECSVGPRGKRVDIVAYGTSRVGVEVGISSVDQEIRNLRLDLESGVLDKVLMVSPDAAFIARVRERACEDPSLAGLLSRVDFFVLDEKEVE